MDWTDHLKLGKSSAFVKTALRRLPLLEAAFEADFFLDAASSSRRHERWMGMVIEREFGGVLAMAAEGKTVELDLNDWGRVLSALCEMRAEEKPVGRRLVRIARRIAEELAEALGIAAPVLRT